MICTAPAQNFWLPEFDVFKLHVELVAVDDIAVRVLGALDPSVLGEFQVHRAPAADDVHVSVLVTADAAQAEQVTTTLTDRRNLVFSIILADMAPDTLSGSYLLCPPHPQNLIPLLVALRRLFFEHSIVGIDLTDFSPVFRIPGRIGFVHRELPQGTRLTEAGAELGQRIHALNASTSTVTMVLATGTEFLDPAMTETGPLHQVDVAVNAIVQPFSDESLQWIAFTCYMLDEMDIFSIGVFFTQ